MALDLGAMSVFLYTFTEREKLYNLFELLTAPVHHVLHRVGDKSAIFGKLLSRNSKKFLDDFGPSLDECDSC